MLLPLVRPSTRTELFVTLTSLLRGMALPSMARLLAILLFDAITITLLRGTAASLTVLWCMVVLPTSMMTGPLVRPLTTLLVMLIRPFGRVLKLLPLCSSCFNATLMSIPTEALPIATGTRC